ncbi:hypothetical protein F5Y10DRAFT_240320 [Nemania abortiva]|nr:hypothetical protein F5Y10DRAFT_240320 [Nemania abortiva]
MWAFKSSVICLSVLTRVLQVPVLNFLDNVKRNLSFSSDCVITCLPRCAKYCQLSILPRFIPSTVHGTISPSHRRRKYVLMQHDLQLALPLVRRNSLI